MNQLPGNSGPLPTLNLLGQILTILGSTKTSFWPFLEDSDFVISEITRTYGESAHLFTMTDPGSEGFMPIRHPSGVHSLHFLKSDSMSGAGEDHADFSFKTSGQNEDDAFSVGAWVNRDVAGAIQAILAKYDVAGTLREWQYTVNASNKPALELYDESADGKEIGTADTALTLNIWQFVCVTYDGTETAPVVTHYLDGVSDSATPTTTETGSYVNMEDLSVPLMLGAADDVAGPTVEMDGRIALPFICGKALTSANVAALHGLGKRLLGL